MLSITTSFYHHYFSKTHRKKKSYSPFVLDTLSNVHMMLLVLLKPENNFQPKPDVLTKL